MMIQYLKHSCTFIAHSPLGYKLKNHGRQHPSSSRRWICARYSNMNETNSSISRRESLSLLARLSSIGLLATSILVFSKKTAIAIDNNDIIFTKLPCDGIDCRSVEIHDYRIGTGAAVENGSNIVIRWTGRLADRYGWPIQKEDAESVNFVIGRDRLIRGFEQAILGMREGGKRRMLIPAELGYVDEKSGPLPASYGDRRRLFATVLNSRRFKRAGDLVIDVQLVKVKPSR